MLVCEPSWNACPGPWRGTEAGADRVSDPRSLQQCGAEAGLYQGCRRDSLGALCRALSERLRQELHRVSWEEGGQVPGSQLPQGTPPPSQMTPPPPPPAPSQLPLPCSLRSGRCLGSQALTRSPWNPPQDSHLEDTPTQGSPSWALLPWGGDTTQSVSFYI